MHHVEMKNISFGSLSCDIFSDAVSYIKCARPPCITYAGRNIERFFHESRATSVQSYSNVTSAAVKSLFHCAIKLPPCIYGFARPNPKSRCNPHD